MVKKLSRRLLWISIIGIMVIFGILLFHFANVGSTLAQNAELSIGPNPASPGATITVTGFNYLTNQTVEIYFQNRSNGIVRTVTNASGFFNASLTLPRRYINEPSFVYTTCGKTTIKQPLRFTRPSLIHVAINHSTVVRAKHPATTLFRGSGFLANERVRLALKHDAQVANIGTSITDAQGHFSFSLKSLNIPFGSKVSITASDGMNQQVTSVVHQSAWINISPFAGLVGTRVSIKGGGFGRSEVVRIFFQDDSMGAVRTDRSGDFSTGFFVSTSARISPFYNAVHVYGSTTRVEASASFQVLPSVSVSPNTGSPGQVVQISGNQFTANGRVDSLMIDPNQSESSVGVPLASYYVSSNGIFTVRSRIPRNVPRGRVYTIVLVDVATGINVTTYFHVD
jgi:hypothetical protein